MTCTGNGSGLNDCKNRDKMSGTDLIEMVPDDLPDAGPLQSDTSHVVVRDLYDLTLLK